MKYNMFLLLYFNILFSLLFRNLLLTYYYFILIDSFKTFLIVLEKKIRRKFINIIISILYYKIRYRCNNIRVQTNNINGGRAT